MNIIALKREAHDLARRLYLHAVFQPDGGRLFLLSGAEIAQTWALKPDESEWADAVDLLQSLLFKRYLSALTEGAVLPEGGIYNLSPAPFPGGQDFAPYGLLLRYRDKEEVFWAHSLEVAWIKVAHALLGKVPPELLDRVRRMARAFGETLELEANIVEGRLQWQLFAHRSSKHNFREFCATDSVHAEDTYRYAEKVYAQLLYERIDEYKELLNAVSEG